LGLRFVKMVEATGVREKNKKRSRAGVIWQKRLKKGGREKTWGTSQGRQRKHNGVGLKKDEPTCPELEKKRKKSFGTYFFEGKTVGRVGAREKKRASPKTKIQKGGQKAPRNVCGL